MDPPVSNALVHELESRNDSSVVMLTADQEENATGREDDDDNSDNIDSENITERVDRPDEDNKNNEGRENILLHEEAVRLNNDNEDNDNSSNHESEEEEEEESNFDDNDDEGTEEDSYVTMQNYALFDHIYRREWNVVLEMLQTEEGIQQAREGVGDGYGYGYASDGVSAIQCACQQDGVPLNVIQALLKVERTKTFYVTPIEIAHVTTIDIALAHNASFDIIKALIDAYPGVAQQTDSMRQLPLHEAASYCSDENIITMLLNAYPNGIKQVDESGNLPIHYAVRSNPNISIVQTLLKFYPNSLQQRNKQGDLPLHNAAYWNPSPNVVKCLTDAYPSGARKQNSAGYLPLHEACSKGRTNSIKETVALLIDAYPESIILTCPNTKGVYLSPLEIASSRMQESLELVEFLIRAEEMYFISLAQEIVTKSY